MPRSFALHGLHTRFCLWKEFSAAGGPTTPSAAGNACFDTGDTYAAAPNAAFQRCSEGEATWPRVGTRRSQQRAATGKKMPLAMTCRPISGPPTYPQPKTKRHSESRSGPNRLRPIPKNAPQLARCGRRAQTVPVTHQTLARARGARRPAATSRTSTAGGLGLRRLTIRGGPASGRRRSADKRDKSQPRTRCRRRRHRPQWQTAGHVPTFMHTGVCWAGGGTVTKAIPRQGLAATQPGNFAARRARGPERRGRTAAGKRYREGHCHLF